MERGRDMLDLTGTAQNSEIRNQRQGQSSLEKKKTERVDRRKLKGRKLGEGLRCVSEFTQECHRDAEEEARFGQKGYLYRIGLFGCLCIAAETSLSHQDRWWSSEADDLLVGVDVSRDDCVLLVYVDRVVREVLEETAVDLNLVAIVEIRHHDSLEGL